MNCLIKRFPCILCLLLSFLFVVFFLQKLFAEDTEDGKLTFSTSYGLPTKYMKVTFQAAEDTIISVGPINVLACKKPPRKYM